MAQQMAATGKRPRRRQAAMMPSVRATVPDSGALGGCQRGAAVVECEVGVGTRADVWCHCHGIGLAHGPASVLEPV